MPEKIRQRFMDLRIAQKLMLVYLLMMLIIGSVAFAVLRISWDVYDEKLYEKSLQELDFFVQQVDNSLQEVESFSYSLSIRTDIQQQLTELKTIRYGTGDYQYQLYQLRILLLSELYSHPIIRNVIFTDQYQSKITVGQASGTMPEGNMALLLERMHTAHGGYVTMDPSAEYPYFVAGRDILEHINSSLDYLGSYIITCDAATVIQQQIDSLTVDHGDLFVYGSHGVIYQGEGTIQPEMPTDKAQGYEVIHVDGERYFMCWLRSPQTGWTYLNLIPYSDIYDQEMSVRNAMIAAVAGTVVLSILAILAILQAITRPLQQLTHAMQVVETGDFKSALALTPEITSRDETGRLTREFHRMVDQIDTLIYENYEKQLLLQETRYQMLQAQINPHFLYNTLNSVTWMIRAGRHGEANKVIVELGQLLRAALAKNPYISVAEEVALVESYMSIQRFRYGSRVSFNVEARGSLDRFVVPRMILQPLVENAIYHGIEQAITHCDVTVLVEEETDTIALQVIDTGLGMTAQTLEAVRNFTVKPKGHGIGLKNIEERLAMAFSRFEFAIDSSPGEGSRITIRVPKKEADRTHV